MAIGRKDIAHLQRASHFTQIPAPALGLLLEAHACACDIRCDPWEFAVEIDCLREAGLTHSQLRWLLRKGYIAQAVEKRRARGKRRAFRPVTNLSLREGTCFVLTDAGLAYSGDDRAQPVARPTARSVAKKPSWERRLRELRLGDVVVKKFRQRAANQELILDAFEEEGWPPRIDDPLSPMAEQDVKRRLHSTIGNLNRSQEIHLIHFEGGGDGQSVCWRLLRRPQGRKERGKTKRVQSECRAKAERV
jgi:hypothetical protein